MPLVMYELLGVWFAHISVQRQSGVAVFVQTKMNSWPYDGQGQCGQWNMNSLKLKILFALGISKSCALKRFFEVGLWKPEV